MGIKLYHYGDLNPATHPQTGRSLDPESFSGIGNLAEAVRKVNRPDFIEKLGSPLKGIIIRVEGKGTDSDEGFGAHTWNSDKVKPLLWRCKVRIPELHAHLPVPETYGEEGLNSVMILYPTFQAKNQDVPPPVVGEICYVDFGDRKRFEDPIYLGMVKSAGAPVDGAASTADENTSASEALNGNSSPLNSVAPSGDPIGQSVEPEADDQVPQTSADYEPEGQVGGPPPELPPSETIGDEEAFKRGKSIGKVRIAQWRNQNGTTKKVVLDMISELESMSNAMKADIQLEIYVNSGFRTNSEQQRLYKKYKSGRGNRAARPGWSNHQSGRAIDLAVWDDSRKKYKRRPLSTNAIARAWLNDNAQNFGFVWREGRRIGEPWHWNYDGSIEGLE